MKISQLVPFTIHEMLCIVYVCCCTSHPLLTILASDGPVYLVSSVMGESETQASSPDSRAEQHGTSVHCHTLGTLVTAHGIMWTRDIWDTRVPGHVRVIH